MELREYLFRKRKSVTALAFEIGLSRNYLSMIANGKKLPSKKIAIKIYNATNGEVTLKDILSAYEEHYV